MAALYEIVDEIEDLFPGRRFTADGQDNVPVGIDSGHTGNLVIRENNTEACIGLEAAVEGQ